jgi:hypothetical protein
MIAYGGLEAGVYLQAFVTTEADETKWLASQPGSFTLGSITRSKYRRPIGCEVVTLVAVSVTSAIQYFSHKNLKVF